MSIADLYTRESITISCELFPPKTEKGMQTLLQNVRRLNSFAPDYYTCTYGAGGSSQNKTLDVLSRIKSEFDIPVASHLTLVNRTVDQLREYLGRATDLGVENIVALRGDPPQGSNVFEACDGGLRYANELVDLIRNEFDHFGIAVAGYPEVHLEAPSAEIDLQNLKRKVDAGADIIITQLFFDNQDFLDFRDRCRLAGIEIPIVPGIMPVTSYQQIKKIASLCGSKLPDDFVTRLANAKEADSQFKVGVEHALSQISNLIDEGVEGLHFYVLNKSDATSAILQAAEIANRIPRNIGS